MLSIVAGKRQSTARTPSVSVSRPRTLNAMATESIVKWVVSVPLTAKMLGREANRKIARSSEPGRPVDTSSACPDPALEIADETAVEPGYGVEHRIDDIELPSWTQIRAGAGRGEFFLAADEHARGRQP